MSSFDNFSSYVLSSNPFRTWWPIVIAFLVGVVTAIRSHIGGPACPCDNNVDGKLIVMTGGSKGIGFEVALELLRRGGRIIIGTRNIQDTFEKFQYSQKCEQKWKLTSVQLYLLDLNSLQSVKQFVSNIGQQKIDILINNAGVAQKIPLDDMHWSINYLGHFLLTHLLLPNFCENCRIIFTAADAHRQTSFNDLKLNMNGKTSPGKGFANSKLAVMLLVTHLSTIWESKGIRVNAVHPGGVRNVEHLDEKSILNKSLIFKLLTWLLWKSPQEAAQTLIYLAVSKKIENVTGKYFINCREADPSNEALQSDFAAQLYKETIIRVQNEIKDEMIN